MDKRMRAFRFRQADERGVTAVVVALMMAVVLPVSAAFAIDIGQQRAVQRDMQSVADVGALDVSRLLTDNRIGLYDRTKFTDELKASIKRNDTTLGVALPPGNTGSCYKSPGNTGVGSVDLSTKTAGACWEFLDNNNDVTWDSSAVPSRIRVRAKSQTGFAFGGVTGVRAGGGTRSAIAEVPDNTMCFEIGSFAAALSLGSSVLGPLADWLGLDVDLDLISYQNLAGANVSLADIALSPGIGSPEALLAPSGITVGQLINATIYALENNADSGSTDTQAALGVLYGLLDIGVGLALDATVVIPDLISVDAGDEASLATDINVLELIGTGLAIANGENFVDTEIPINLTSIGLGTGNVKVSAIQGTQRACGKPDSHPADECGEHNGNPNTVNGRGGACAIQSQVSFALSLDPVDIPLLNTGNIAGLLSASSNLTVGPVTLTGGVGNAKGVLTSIDRCGPPDELTVNASAGLLGVVLSVGLHLNANLQINLGNVLGPLQNVVGNVLNLPALLGGLFDGKMYQYQNYRLSIEIGTPADPVGTTLTTSSAATTNTTNAELESPTNDKPATGKGTPVKVPNPPVAPQLAPLAIPSDLLEGRVKVRLSYDWRRANALLSLVQTGPWGPGPNRTPRPPLTAVGWGPNDGWISSSSQLPPGSPSDVLLDGDLSDLRSLPGVLGDVGGAVQSTLTGVLAALNNPVTGVVGVVNTTLNGTLLPLLGLSGSGADLYSVNRKGATCGGTPKMVG